MFFETHYININLVLFDSLLIRFASLHIFTNLLGCPMSYLWVDSATGSSIESMIGQCSYEFTTV